MRVDYPAAVLARAGDVVDIQAQPLVHGLFAYGHLVGKFFRVAPGAAVDDNVAAHGVAGVFPSELALKFFQRR